MTGAVKEKRKARKPHIDPADYRRPLQIAQIRIFQNCQAYYVCPRCDSSLDREYMSYCDRCGQHLNWKNWKKVERICILWDGNKNKKKYRDASFAIPIFMEASFTLTLYSISLFKQADLKR